MSSSVPYSPARLGAITRTIVLVIAAIGFLFDTYELLMFPVIGSNAVGELIQVNSDGSSPGWSAELGFTSSPELKRGTPPTSVPVRTWGGRMLWIAALCGGVFGLLGGLLIDRLGRKTIMVASILAYSLSPVAAAYSTELWHLVLFRCTTFIGVCVEMIAAVTWLAELFEDKRTRELAIGWTLAAASLGGILVTEAFNEIVALQRAGHLPPLPFMAGHGGSLAWRYTLLTGLVPGALILVLMPFVPESGVWRRKKQDGTLRRPSFGELFSPELRRTTLTTTVLSACGYAAAFGAIQMGPLQIVAGLPGVNASYPKEVRAAETRLKQAEPKTPEHAAAEKQLAAAKKAAAPQLAEYAQTLTAARGDIQRWQEIGGLVGRISLAVLLIFLPSRLLIRLYLIPGIILFPLTYFPYFDFAFVHSPYAVFATSTFFCGLLTVAQFSFLSEFLPRVFPLHLRGTGGSFASNVGGRMIGTMAALLNTELLAPLFRDQPTPMQVSAAAAVIGFSVYLLAFLATFLLPAPHAEVAKQEQVYGRDEALPEPTAETVD